MKAPALHSQSICPLPWTGFEVRADGTKSVCCRSRLTLSEQHERAQDPALNRLKARMINGEKPEECNACWSLEAHNSISERQAKLKLESGLASALAAEPWMDWPIQLFDFKIGNVCNQKCLVCNSHSSSLWSREPQFDGFAGQGGLSFGVNRNSFADFQAQIRQAEQIDLSGGEPFMNPKTLQPLCEILEAQNSPRKKSLSIVTNGSVAPDFALLDRLKPHFEKIGIYMSADGTHQQFNYLRFPADWAVFFENYQRLRDTPFFGGIGMTLSGLNLYEIDDSLKFWEDHGEPRLYFNYLNFPSALSLKTLPTAVLMRVREKFLGASFKSQQTHDLLNSLLLFIQGLIVDSSRKTELGTLLNYIDFCDAHRKTSFRATFPRYHQLLTAARPRAPMSGAELNAAQG